MRFGTLAASVCAVVCLSAAPVADAPNLSKGFKFGEHWFGPDLTEEDLKGRVVLIEDWGYN